MTRKVRRRLRAFLDGAASVFDIGIGAGPIRYRGPEHDAQAMRSDFNRLGKDLRRSMKVHERLLEQ